MGKDVSLILMEAARAPIHMPSIHPGVPAHPKSARVEKLPAARADYSLLDIVTW